MGIDLATDNAGPMVAEGTNTAQVVVKAKAKRREVAPPTTDDETPEDCDRIFRTQMKQENSKIGALRQKRIDQLIGLERARGCRYCGSTTLQRITLSDTHERRIAVLHECDECERHYVAKANADGLDSWAIVGGRWLHIVTHRGPRTIADLARLSYLAVKPAEDFDEVSIDLRGGWCSADVADGDTLADHVLAAVYELSKGSNR